MWTILWSHLDLKWRCKLKNGAERHYEWSQRCCRIQCMVQRNTVFSKYCVVCNAVQSNTMQCGLLSVQSKAMFCLQCNATLCCVQCNAVPTVECLEQCNVVWCSTYNTMQFCAVFNAMQCPEQRCGGKFVWVGGSSWCAACTQNTNWDQYTNTNFNQNTNTNYNKNTNANANASTK